MADRLLSALIGSTDRWQKFYLKICGCARHFIRPGHIVQLAEQIDEPACRGNPEKALHIGTGIIVDAVRNAARDPDVVLGDDWVAPQGLSELRMQRRD